MFIAMIRRGGAHDTRVNHQKRNNQRELDIHGLKRLVFQSERNVFRLQKAAT
jgi:hypothetical protein